MAKILLSAFVLLCFQVSPLLAEDKVSVEIGKNVKVGMPLKEVISLLGIPGFIKITRGTEPAFDALVIDYPDYGLAIYAINKGTVVEGVEILHGFKGLLPSGVKIGDKFQALVDKFGVPQSMLMDIARYPDQGLYLNLKEGALLSAKMFVKGSKLLESRLADPNAN